MDCAWLTFIFIFYFKKLIPRSPIKLYAPSFINFSMELYFEEILLYEPYTNFSYFDLMPNFNFSREWVGESPQKIHKSKNNQFCPVCRFKEPTKKPFSENKIAEKPNLIMTIYVNSIYNMFVMARSLRTTGCEAEILYFVDNTIDSTFSEDDRKLFQNCGITILNYGDAPQPYNSVVNYRFIIFSEYMNRYYQHYEKVIIADGFDTVFQSDPFRQDWKEGVVYLALENNKNRVTRGWYDRLFPNEDIRDVLNSQIVNNGVVAASSNEMVRYLDFFTRRYDWKKWGDGLDQALVNYLVYRGNFSAAGIKIELMCCGCGFLASIYNCYGDTDIQKLGSFAPRSNFVFPSLIHKFSERISFGTNVYLQCPRLSWQKNLKQYIRKLDLHTMNELDRKINEKE